MQPANLTNIYAAVVRQKFVPLEGGASTRRRGGYQVSQTLPVDVNFPISFELGLYALPPEYVLVDVEICKYMMGMYCPLEDSEHQKTLIPYRWTLGFLVMFHDGNGNGTLDMSEDGVTFVDTIFGSAPNHTLLYIESEQEHPVQMAPEYTRGLAVYKGNPATIMDTQAHQPRTPVPLDEPIQLTLANDLLNQAFMCPNGHGSLELSGGGYAFRIPATCDVVSLADMQNHFQGMVINGRDGFCDSNNRTFT